MRHNTTTRRLSRSVALWVIASLVGTVLCCSSDTGSCLPDTDYTYPDEPPVGGEIRPDAALLYVDDELLVAIKARLGALLGSFVDIEMRDGRQIVVYYLDELNIAEEGMAGIAIRDGCLGDSSSEPLSPDECSTDGDPTTMPTYRSRVELDLDTMLERLQVSFTEGDATHQLGVVAKLEQVPVSVHLATLLDISLLGLGGVCLLADGTGAGGQPEPALNVHLIEIEILAGLAPTADGTSLVVDLRGPVIELSDGGAPPTMNLSSIPCDGSDSCSDPLCDGSNTDFDCVALCQTADLLAQVLGDLALVIEPILVDALAPMLSDLFGELVSEALGEISLPLQMGVVLSDIEGADGFFNVETSPLDISAGPPPDGLSLQQLPSGSGVLVGLDLGLSAEPSLCLPHIGDPDLERYAAPAPVFSGFLSVPGDGGSDSVQVVPYHAAVALSQAAVNQALVAATRSGALCLGIDSAAIEELTGGAFALDAMLLGTFIPQVLDLTEPSTPVLLSLTPLTWPEVRLGSGQGEDSLIALEVPQVALSIYLHMGDRYARMVGMNFRMEVAVGFARIDGSLALTIDRIQVDNIQVTFDELIPGADFESFLPAIVELALSQLLSDQTVIPVDIEGMLNDSLTDLGLEVRFVKVRKEPYASLGDDPGWLALYAALCPPGDGGSDVDGSSDDDPACAYSRTSPIIGRLPLGCPQVMMPDLVTPFLGVPANQAAFAYKIDDGPWWRGQTIAGRCDRCDQGTLLLEDPFLRLPGPHTVRVVALPERGNLAVHLADNVCRVETLPPVKPDEESAMQDHTPVRSRSVPEIATNPLDAVGCSATGAPFAGLPVLWLLLLGGLLLARRSRPGHTALALVALVVLATAACGDPIPVGTDPKPAEEGPVIPNVIIPLAVNTRLVEPVIQVGQTTQVRCSATRSGQIENIIEWTLTSTDPQLATTTTASGGTVSHTRTGAYPVSCSAAGYHDDSPAWLTVVPGDPATITTQVEPTTVEAGLPARAWCTVSDAHGNIIDAISWGLELDQELDFEAPDRISSSVPGTYDVHCRVGELYDSTGASLTVTLGSPWLVEVSAEPVLLGAGEQPGAQLGCQVWDRVGNPLPDAPVGFTIVPVEGTLGVDTFHEDDDSLWGTHTGQVLVFCHAIGSRAADDVPAVVTIEPGLPARIEVGPYQSSCLTEGQTFDVPLTAFDEYDNPIGDVPLLYLVSPTDGVTRDGQGRPIFSLEGEYQVTVEVAPPTAVPNLNHTTTITIDSTPPSLTVSPDRAEAVTAGGNPDMSLAIEVWMDEGVSAPAYAIIEGHSYALTPGVTRNETFNQDSRWGLNMLEGYLVDACGNSRSHLSSYLRAPAYYEAATGALPAAQVPDGLMVYLSQEMIDDGVRGHAGNPTEFDDLASLGQAVIDGIDFNQIIDDNPDFIDPYDSTCDHSDPDGSWPDRVWLIERENCRLYNCGFWPVEWTQRNYQTGYGVRKIGALVWDGLDIDNLWAVNGGMRLVGGIGANDGSVSLNIPLRVYGDLDTGCLGEINVAVSGYVEADSVDVDATLNVTLVGGLPEVTIPSISVSVDDLYVYVQLFGVPFLDGIISDIISGIAGWFQGYIDDMIADILRDELPPVMEDFLGSISIATSFDLPAPIDMTLNLDTVMSSLDFSGPQGSGHGIIGFGAQIFPSSVGTSGDPNLGSPAHQTAPFGFSGVTQDFAASLQDDLINQALWAVWYGGGLELTEADLGSLMDGLSLSGVEMSLSAQLPPVIMPGLTPGDVEVGIGDALVHVALDLGELMGLPDSSVLEMDLYVSALLAGNLATTGQEIDITIYTDPPPLVKVEVLQVNDSQADVAIYSQIFEDIFAQVLPKLIADILSSIPIPAIDLSSLGVPGLPPGTSLFIDSPVLDRPDNFSIRLKGSVGVVQ